MQRVGRLLREGPGYIVGEGEDVEGGLIVVVWDGKGDCWVGIVVPGSSGFGVREPMAEVVLLVFGWVAPGRRCWVL